MTPLIPPLMLLAGLGPAAFAKGPSVPRREIPPSVLVELQDLENRFELALSMDCAAERCFSTGCTYIDHTVTDQPRKKSLPGLADDAGPGSAPTQAYLTQATCGFAHEAAEASADVQTLTRRLQAKLSGGWTTVSVSATPLQPLPEYMRAAPVPEEDEEALEEVAPEPEPEPEPFSAAVAGHQLWDTLLPHAFWMLGIGLVTLAAGALIWSWRRVGRASVEEQMLLAQMAREGDAPAEAAEPVAVEADPAAEEAAFVAERQAAWAERLAAVDAAHPDRELQVLVRALLRAGEIPLLAKAVLTFPERFPATFPAGGDVATAKLQLAEFLTTVDAAELPAEADFYRALDRHALAASLTAHGDAEVVRSLREDFGAAGLAELVTTLPARMGGLVFALSPADAQLEMVRLLPASTIRGLSAALLRSNRMDPRETAWLFDLLRSARGDEAPPPPPPSGEITDRGAAFDAAGALSILLARLAPDARIGLFQEALTRSRGALPSWTRDILYPDLLLALSAEERADLLLGVDAVALAAWLATRGDEAKARVLDRLPLSLQATVDGAVVPVDRRSALAARGQAAVSAGFQAQLVRRGQRFEDALLRDAVDASAAPPTDLELD